MKISQNRIFKMARSNKHMNFSLCLAVHILLISLQFSGVLGYSEIHEKIHYHLRELNNGLQELRASKPHVIHKRSISDHDELIYNSLMAFCSEMNSDNGFSTTTKKETQNVIPTSTKKPTPLDKSWLKSMVLPPPGRLKIPKGPPISTWPHLFPLKVQAERAGTSVWLVFNLVHKGPVTVSNLHSFDASKVFVDYPPGFSSNGAAVESKVRIQIDASVCKFATRPYDDHSADIGFVLSGKQSFWVMTTINLCMFDYFLNGTTADGKDKWDVREERIFNETISPPFFRITSGDPGDEITIHKGHNVVLEMDVILKGYLGMTIEVKMWDRRAKRKIKILKSIIRFSIHRGSVKVFPAETNSENLLSVEILEQMNVGMAAGQMDKDSGVDGGTNAACDEGDPVRAKVRVTIETSVGRRSGKLAMQYDRHTQCDNKESLVQFLNAVRFIDIKLPHKSDTLPKNYVEITDHGRLFICDAQGNRHFAKYGKNCTIHCYARGTDIKDISISSTGLQQRQPVNSLSQVHEGATVAFAMIDLGPASKDIEGTYTCTATTSNGKKKKENFKLFTSLFTQVFYNMTVRETRNFTAVVICSAFGAQPLNMSVLVSTDDGVDERVDNKSISRHISIRGHQSNLTVELPIVGPLRNPNASITCQADGERGSAGNAMSLNEYIDYSPLPNINHDAKFTNITQHKNGTVEIHCEAKGDEPLEFVVKNGEDIVGNNPGSVRTITETPRGKMLTFFDKKENFVPGKPISCQVKNFYGEAGFDVAR